MKEIVQGQMSSIYILQSNWLKWHV